MAEADDYESLPATTPFKYVALAGAAAGVAEHVALFPVDSVKVGHRLISLFRENREFYLEKLEWDRIVRTDLYFLFIYIYFVVMREPCAIFRVPRTYLLLSFCDIVQKALISFDDIMNLYQNKHCTILTFC